MLHPPPHTHMSAHTQTHTQKPQAPQSEPLPQMQEGETLAIQSVELVAVSYATGSVAPCLKQMHNMQLCSCTACQRWPSSRWSSWR